MAKQTSQSAKVTAEFPGIPVKRGRPFTGKAKSPAQRMQAYRERKAASQREAIRQAKEIFKHDELPKLAHLLESADSLVAYNAWVEIGRRSGYFR